MKKLAILALAAMLVVSGCGSFKKQDTRTDEQLVRDGVVAYDKGDYKKAIEAFERLRDWYPFSRYLILAELKLADSYFQRKKYPEAVAAYEHFERMHPTNDAVPYAIYQTGMSWFEQRRSPDRDQVPSEMALAAFYRLLESFPDSQYAQQAAAPIKECHRLLAEHDFEVGRFYYRQGNYKAAIARFEKVLTNYEDVGVHNQALDYMALAKERLLLQEKKAADKNSG
ncbi:MAG: outer membrane protein assembly factor BamD [Desulfatibacillaceae bacterium]|nr:outer membrane protein assembly factor BamD [Desulfatibacillaceae bacterium]